MKEPKIFLLACFIFKAVQACTEPHFFGGFVPLVGLANAITVSLLQGCTGTDGLIHPYKVQTQPQADSDISQGVRKSRELADG